MRMETKGEAGRMVQAYVPGAKKRSAHAHARKPGAGIFGPGHDLLALAAGIGNSSAMHVIPWLFLILLLPGCQEGTGIWLADGWREETVAECADDWPDMLLLSANGRFLYQTCEKRANQLSPSLARIDLQSGKRGILLYGLDRADGIRMSADGSLWIGEETGDGLVWRITQPELLPPEQRVDRIRLAASDKRIRPVPAAGRMLHEGLSFSRDQKFLYLADEWAEGCLYRLHLAEDRLQVFHDKNGWLDITNPAQARIEAERLHGRLFERPEDMELLPDGRILIAETGNGDNTGRILALTDSDSAPTIAVYLEDARIHHPDNLDRDAARNWLWISDDDKPSHLWAWDGKALSEIARHGMAEITGVESAADGAIYINLQRRIGGPDLTLRLRDG
ncbi:MAG: hypothetical protein R8K46_00870 [Mariprofundaceae bacterium]